MGSARWPFFLLQVLAMPLPWSIIIFLMATHGSILHGGCTRSAKILLDGCIRKSTKKEWNPKCRRVSNANRHIWGDNPWFFCTKYQKIEKKFKVDSAFSELSHSYNTYSLITETVLTNDSPRIWYRNQSIIGYQ